jgi:hypothetical protein
LYEREFSNIPEKFRPKAKAYVARAAFYKAQEANRNAYVKEWLAKDRAAAMERMKKGRGRKTEKAAKPSAANTYSERSPRLSIGSTRKIKFDPSANPLRTRAARVEEKLQSIAARAEKILLAKIVDRKTRKVARHLVAEMKKAAHILTKEAKHQATQLERAAVQRLHMEVKKAAVAPVPAPVPVPKPASKKTTLRKSNKSSNLGANNFQRELGPKSSSNTNITPITVRSINNSNNATAKGLESKNSAVLLNDYEYR